MSFQPGKSGNPAGRPKGSYGGRIKALATLDRMMAKKKNQLLLEKDLEREFQNGPAQFFKSFVIPLLPRESKLKFEQDNVIEWRSLLDVEPVNKEIRDGKTVSLLPAASGETPEAALKGA